MRLEPVYPRHDNSFTQFDEVELYDIPLPEDCHYEFTEEGIPIFVCTRNVSLLFVICGVFLLVISLALFIINFALKLEMAWVIFGFIFLFLAILLFRKASQETKKHTYIRMSEESIEVCYSTFWDAGLAIRFPRNDKTTAVYEGPGPSRGGTGVIRFESFSGITVRKAYILNPLTSEDGVYLCRFFNWYLSSGEKLHTKKPGVLAEGQ